MERERSVLNGEKERSVSPESGWLSMRWNEQGLARGLSLWSLVLMCALLIPLMPTFFEEDANTFFDAFEVVARECDWPEAKWPLLVQSVLKGKVAFAALDPRMGLEYDI